MTIEPIVCSHCHAALADVGAVGYNDIIGIFFKCAYCGCVNKIGSLPGKEERKKKDVTAVRHTEDLGSSIWIGKHRLGDPVATLSPGEMIDAINATRPTKSGDIKMTVWKEKDDKVSYMKSLKKPVHVADFQRLNIGAGDDSIFLYRINDSDSSARLTKLIGVVSKVNEGTFVLNDWVDLASTALKRIRDIVDEENRRNRRAMARGDWETRRAVELTPSDYMARNDIIEWFVHSLCHLADNGVDVELMCNWKPQYDFMSNEIHDDIMKFNAPRKVAHYLSEISIPSMGKSLMNKNRAMP